MFFIKSSTIIALFVFCITSTAFPQIEFTTDSGNTSLAIYGDAGTEFGQCVTYYYRNDTELHRQWLQKSLLHLGVQAAFNRRVQVGLGVEGRLWFNSPDQAKQTTGQAYLLYDINNTYLIHEARGTFLFGDPSCSFLSITAGKFIYKYNPEVRNLGEYLFRSGTYPAVLMSQFDMPFARLTGIKISSDLFEGNVHQDLMLTLETEMYPFNDGTLSYLARGTIANFLDIGLGVSFAHLISVNESVTTPKSDARNMYLENGTDTSYYTFRGTKLMGRITIDPKRFIPLEWFGEEDLKIFAEVAVLGVKNYPKNDSLYEGGPVEKANIWGYDTLKNKIPVVFGMNIPTFKLLDVLALEIEYYGCTYPNNTANAIRLGTRDGIPIPSFNYHRSYDYTKNNWKWSVYGKKMLANDHLGIIVQFARDHIRFEHSQDESKVYEEALVKPSNWWWTAKVIAAL